MVINGKQSDWDEIRDAIIRMSASSGVDLSNWKPGDGRNAIRMLDRTPQIVHEDEHTYRQRLEKYFQTNGCDSRYDEKVIDWMMSLRANRETAKGLYLHGVPGSGKTRRMEAIAKWYGIECLDAKTLVNTIKSLKNDNARRDYIKIPSYGNSTMKVYDLIIDDIGCEIDKNNPFAENYQAMEWVIRERYRVFPQCKTIFASNLPPDDLYSYYGEKNAGRIFEMCDFLDAGTNDYRTIQGELL